jgi:crotonobetainyl-CoA:carnitine CoA-transferase CaiB-like acyl-CoA transferase
MVDSLLSGFKALDLTDEKGFVCGKTLAAVGVDVIKVEKPGGDPARSIPPFYNDTPDLEKSLYWFAFNTDKRSITLNLESSQGQDLFRKLVGKADFVLESFSPSYMDSLGLGYEALSQINPRIIMTSITPFGQKGPYSSYKGCELIASAMSGVLENTGDPDRSPVKEALDSCCFRAGAAAACWTVISHYYREITGEGQHVDVSIQEVNATRNPFNLALWEFDKRLLKRSGPLRQFGVHPTKMSYPCKDGYISWSLIGGPPGASQMRALAQWITEEGMENPLRQVVNWEGFDMASITRETLDAFEEAIGKFFLKHSKNEIAEEGLRRGIQAISISSPADVCEDRQLKARNFWVDLDHPELGITLTYPKHFFVCSETENYVRRRAPLIGEDNDEIYKKTLGLSSSEINLLKEANVI